MNYSNIWLLLFILIGSFAKGQSIFIGSNVNERLSIKQNTSLHLDGLTIIPSSDFNLFNTKLSKLGSTNNAINSSISKSYYFDAATSNFSGSLKITYQDSELNGEIESDIKIVLFDGVDWIVPTTTSSNTIANTFNSSVNNISIIEVTMSSYKPNSAPSNISISSSSVNENVANGTTIGVLSTTDSDSGDTHTYTLVSGTGDTDNASFDISGADLNILTRLYLEMDPQTMLVLALVVPIY
jgi:hypothetical protein